MHKSIFVTALSVIFLSVPVAPFPLDRTPEIGTYTGKGTWSNDGFSTCGYANSPSDPIVALSTQLYDFGARCNQWVSITNTATGQTATGMVRGECPGCATVDLDMSVNLFEQLGALAENVLPISWAFI